MFLDNGVGSIEVGPHQMSSAVRFLADKECIASVPEKDTLPLIPLSCFFEIRETIKFFDRPREQMHLGYSAIQE